MRTDLRIEAIPVHAEVLRRSAKAEEAGGHGAGLIAHKFSRDPSILATMGKPSFWDM